MRILELQRRTLISASLFILICSGLGNAVDQPNLTKDQIRQFLMTAKVIASHQSSKGITSPWRLTLSDGTLTHDASFRAVDEHNTSMQLPPRGTELHFVDSYRYRIAAYSID